MTALSTRVKYDSTTPGYFKGRLYPLPDESYRGVLFSSRDARYDDIVGAPIFYAHKYTNFPVGKILSYEFEVDSDTGKRWLVIEGLIYENTQYSSQVMQKIRSREISSLSIGYSVDNDIDLLANGTANKTFIEASVCEKPLYEGCQIMVTCSQNIDSESSEDNNSGAHKLLLISFNRAFSMSEPASTTANQTGTPATSSQPNDTNQSTQSPVKTVTAAGLIESLASHPGQISEETIRKQTHEDLTNLSFEAMNALQQELANRNELQSKLQESAALLEQFKKAEEQRAHRKQQKFDKQFEPVADTLSEMLEKCGAKRTRNQVMNVLRTDPDLTKVLGDALTNMQRLERENITLKNTHNQLSTGRPSPAQLMVNASSEARTAQVLNRAGLNRGFSESAGEPVAKVRNSSFAQTEAGATAIRYAENNDFIQSLYAPRR